MLLVRFDISGIVRVSCFQAVALIPKLSGWYVMLGFVHVQHKLSLAPIPSQAHELLRSCSTMPVQRGLRPSVETGAIMVSVTCPCVMQAISKG